MCDVKKSFFRPWKGASLNQEQPPRVCSVKSETEDDNESVISNPRSASSCSIASCDDIPESGSLGILSNFVFNSTQGNQIITAADDCITGRSYSSSISSTPNGSPSAFTSIYQSIHPHYIATLRGESATQFEIYQAQLNSYGLHVPLGSYPSMEEAIKIIHQQDAVAKQIKKMRPKKFRCEHCDVAFSNNGQLKGHIRIHTGERPFKCDAENCGKSFTRNEELTRHKRIHTGLRPHSCLICGKKFGRKDHLKKHMRTHDNRGPYHLPGLETFTFRTHLSPHAISSYTYPM